MPIKTSPSSCHNKYFCFPRVYFGMFLNLCKISNSLPMSAGPRGNSIIILSSTKISEKHIPISIPLETARLETYFFVHYLSVLRT